MMDVTFEVNGVAMNQKLAAYDVTREVSYKKTITTMDDVEHALGQTSRAIITVSFWPLTDAEVKAYHSVLNSASLVIRFTDPDADRDVSKAFRLNSNLQSVFGLRSIDGNRYYKGGEIQLRAVSVDA